MADPIVRLGPPLVANKDQSRVSTRDTYATTQRDVAVDAPNIGAAILPAGFSKPQPGVGSPMQSAAFAQAPRAFAPSRTAFAGR